MAFKRCTEKVKYKQGEREGEKNMNRGEGKWERGERKERGCGGWKEIKEEGGTEWQKRVLQFLVHV